MEHQNTIRLVSEIIFFFRWYMKAQQLNPKNGRPYNQLALLAVYAVSSHSSLLKQVGQDVGKQQEV